MNLMKKSFSLLLAVAMVFTATFGCMTVSSFAADSGTGSGGPKLVDYSLEVFNTDPKTEAGSEIKVALDFDKELKLTTYAKNAFNILINNRSLSDMGFNNPVVSVDSEDNTKLILDIKGISHENVSDDWTYLISGSIDISLKSNYYEDITDTSGNQVSEWTDIHTMVPTGLEFTEKSHTDGAEGDGTEGSAVCESVTFDLTGDAKLRGASPIQILLLSDDNDLDEAIGNTILAQEKVDDTTYGGQCNLARSTVNIHTHKYLNDSNATWANNLANNFYSKNYTMTADGASVTITAKKASSTQKLNNVVLKMFGYDGPNDRYVQQTLFKNEISDAEARLASIDDTKVTAANKAALESAISEAKASYSAISDNTTAVEFNKARNSLRNAVTNAADNAITTSQSSRNSGTVSLQIAGGSDWTDKITEISVDGKAIPASDYTLKGTSLRISSSCFTKTTRVNDYTVAIKSEGYADVTKTISVTYYGAQSFQIRYLDGNGNVIKSKTYSKADIINMSADKDYYYNTACSMTGVRTFKARGVTLNQLLDDAGITFGPGMTEKIRTNDSVEGDQNDPTDENAYYERGSRTYESLMQKRYYFPDLFNPESDVAKTVSSERGVTDAVRKALGASTTKVETEPMIAYEYVEKVYSSDKTSLENDAYDENMNSDKCFRFLFGTAMDENDPTMAAKEVTTWSVSYNTFGIDIVDPNYTGPVPDHSTGHITGFSFENVEGPASGEAGQTISLNVEFSKDIKVLDAEKAAEELNIKIAGGNVKSTARDITVSASGNVLNIKMVSNGWAAIYGGTLSVDADSIQNIVDTTDNAPVEWDSFTTYIPIGITLDNQTKAGTADAAASDTVKVTHKANMRGMYHFQLMSNGEPVLGNTSNYYYAGAMTSHAHMFNTSITEKTIASAMADAINSAKCGYTAEYQADTDTFTVTADTAKAGEIITVQMLEANSDLRDQKALLNEAKARVDSIEVKTAAANEALAAYNTFIALDDSAKTQMAYAKVVSQMLSSIAPAEIDEDSAAVLDGSGVTSIDLLSLPEGWADAVKTITVKENVKDAVEKTYTKEEAGFSIYTGRWGSSIDLNSKLFESSNKRNTFVVTIKADGFEDASGYVDVKNYGADKFYIRYIDGKTGNVIKSKAYTKEELKNFSKAQKDAMYQTYCSMAGLRNFCADGVLLEDLMADAGITGKAGMTVQVRTNDSAADESGNDSETDNAYYRMGKFKYEDLFADRYYFPAVFTDEALKAKLSASDAKFVGTGSEETRTALGSSEGKVAVRPMIAWNYDEKVFKSTTDMPSSANYSDRTENERAFRFLYGIGMESDNVTANETTTWSATYCAFGVDIIDPDYTKPSSGGSSSGSSTTVTPTKYTVSKPADTAEGKVSVSPSSAEKGDTVTITVTPANGYKTGTVTVTDKNGSKVSVSGSENKYTFKMPASAVTVKVTYEKTAAVEQPAQTGELPFKDVKADRWSYSAIKYAYDNKLFSGTSNDQFSPTDKMTRGMLVTVLYRLAGQPEVNGAAGFNDINSGDWYAKAVAWAKANNIVSGVSANEFAPNNEVTREQMATILYRYASFKGYSTAVNGSVAGFNDNSQVSGFAKDALSWAVGEKLVSGTGNNTLAPKGDATREQVATILQRFAENIAK